MADHDGIDLQSEVNRILGALKLEEIRKHGIKKLPEEQLQKAQAGFQNDVQQKITDYLSAADSANQRARLNSFLKTFEGKRRRYNEFMRLCKLLSCGTMGL